MSAAALAAPPAGRLFEPAQLGGDREPRRSPTNRSDGGRLTLEQLLEHAWEGLHAAGAAECPVCAGRMQERTDRRAACCGDCGALLA